jgi:hypothetical protein
MITAMTKINAILTSKAEVCTTAMAERSRVGVEWKDEGRGYYSGVGSYMGVLAYVALPPDHYCTGKDYNDFTPVVNGGLTFGVDNVFGWDYCHAYNHHDVDGDIKKALTYFRRMNNPLWRRWFDVSSKTENLRWKIRLQIRKGMAHVSKQ